ncbi:MAG: putative inorganic polyphosphate/ATP-NAD kinase [Bacteroidetes bacterium ADurb.Bin035]|nr:MAG: putative inorganic polyphosphate/ATP-NAD kinase [Bacteroidetes bacterium ADurb.Bin035]HNW21186.1 NAD(+)/NADH kinase [Bacteroidales bacterium]
MNILIFFSQWRDIFFDTIKAISLFCEKENGNVGIYFDNQSDNERIKNKISQFENIIIENNNFKNKYCCIISLGGDGTLLDTLPISLKYKLPVYGINYGKLGFLTWGDPQYIVEYLNRIKNNEYNISKRATIELNIKEHTSLFHNALNEVTIKQYKDQYLISVELYINDNFVCSYWADGLIVATPTGSTAYSLSCGGPILEPTAANFVITPIAPHNLTSRPLVIRDDTVLTLIVKYPDIPILLTADANNHIISAGQQVILKKSKNYFPLIEFEENSFYKVLRNKLMWGQDNRK